MKRFILSVALVLIAIVAMVSVAHGAPREEITLTTIVPDQTVLIVKKGVVGYNYHRAAAANPDALPNSDLYVEGNVGIGTTEPNNSKGSGGYIDVQDAWLRDAGSAGAWASQIGGGFDPSDVNAAGWGNDSEGSVAFPNGLIIKWGKYSYSGDTTTFQTVSFSSAFPNACFQVVAVGGDSAGSFADPIKIINITKNSFQMYIRHNMEPAHWFAMGR